MLRRTFFLLAFAISITTEAQSKTETETWIKSFMSTYSNGNITFQNGIMTFDNPYDPIGFHTRASVRIEDLGGVKIIEGPKGNTAIYLSCYDGNCVNDGLKLQTQASFDKFVNHKFGMQFNSSLPSDLQFRINKAFSHLIKLYGGKVLSNTF